MEGSLISPENLTQTVMPAITRARPNPAAAARASLNPLLQSTSFRNLYRGSRSPSPRSSPPSSPPSSPRPPRRLPPMTVFSQPRLLRSSQFETELASELVDRYGKENVSNLKYSDLVTEFPEYESLLRALWLLTTSHSDFPPRYRADAEVWETVENFLDRDTSNLTPPDIVRTFTEDNIRRSPIDVVIAASREDVPYFITEIIRLTKDVPFEPTPIPQTPELFDLSTLNKIEAIRADKRAGRITEDQFIQQMFSFVSIPPAFSQFMQPDPLSHRPLSPRPLSPRPLSPTSPRKIQTPPVPSRFPRLSYQFPPPSPEQIAYHKSLPRVRPPPVPEYRTRIGSLPGQPPPARPPPRAPQRRVSQI